MDQSSSLQPHSAARGGIAWSGKNTGSGSGSACRSGSGSGCGIGPGSASVSVSLSGLDSGSSSGSGSVSVSVSVLLVGLGWFLFCYSMSLSHVTLISCFVCNSGSGGGVCGVFFLVFFPDVLHTNTHTLSLSLCSGGEVLLRHGTESELFVTWLFLFSSFSSSTPPIYSDWAP